MLIGIVFLWGFCFLDNYYNADNLKAHIGAVVDYYDNRRYYESLDNVTSSDAYHGRAVEVGEKRKRITERTMKEKNLSEGYCHQSRYPLDYGHSKSTLFDDEHRIGKDKHVILVSFKDRAYENNHTL